MRRMRDRTGPRPLHIVPGRVAAVIFILVGVFAVAPCVAQEYGDGGPEFDPTGWLTKQDYKPIGDPAALRVEKERPFIVIWESYPPTLRTDGPNSNLVQTSTIHSLIFESMIQIDPETEEFMPCLASHWRMETDKEEMRQTFTFRLDPKARWSDGSPVTADDVYASWWHRVQEDRNDPSNVMTFDEGYEEPEVLGKYIIRVKTKTLNWRLFLYFGGMAVYPAKYVRIPGEQFLEEYNWKLMMGTGPYFLNPEDLKKGESLTLTRRDDWWAENEPWATNTYNFQRIKFIVVRERELEYEMFKKGELDYFVVSRAQRWVEDIPKEDVIRKGWVQRRKIYNEAPQGFAGFCFNMRKPPFDDKRVRLAFCHLFNRERLMEKLFFQEYEYINSYFPGRDWGNGRENPPMFYDPERAASLLGEAGYKERNQDGYLVGPDGKVLKVTLRYASQAWERIWLVVKEDYEKAGVKFNLELLDGTTLMKMITERQFTIHFQSWGALLFPNPETSWRSSLADQPANNNIPGFKNARVDELCARYNEIFDRTQQKKIIREVDKIVYEEHPYALGWFANFNRLLFWDRFGHPDTYFTRISQVPVDAMIALWWFDPAREKALQDAMDRDEALPGGQMIVKPWDPDDVPEGEKDLNGGGESGGANGMDGSFNWWIPAILILIVVVAVMKGRKPG